MHVELSKNKAIILAKIGENIIFDIVSTSNYLSSHELVSTIQKKFEISKNTQIVFITDGETCFVDSIRLYFPNAIHIRQFHSQSCKGIIYIHFRENNVDYTLRCLWDAVLDEGVPTRKVIKQREFKANKKINEKERKNKIRYSELSTDVILWKGVVKSPRGTRRILKKKSDNKAKTISVNKKNKLNINTFRSDTYKEIFRGNLKDAKKMKILSTCFRILKKTFWRSLHKFKHC